MTNPVVKALEHGAGKLGKALGKDAGKAVEDLYHGTGQRMKKVAANHAENDKGVADHFKGLGKDGTKDPKSPKPQGGGSSGAGGGGKGGGQNGPAGGSGRNPWWHGHSSDEMRHHRRPPVDVSGMDREAQLKVLGDESRHVADDARKADPNNIVPGKDYRKDGCAGSFLHDGTITAHTSSVRRKVPQSQKDIDAGIPAPVAQEHPKAHPALQNLLDDVKAKQLAEGNRPGVGHGNCAEVSLVSDRLHQLDPTGTRIKTPEDARRELEGGVMHSRQIGELKEKDPETGKKVVALEHGAFKPPCRSCEHMLPALGISVHSE
ncbi:YwqJ-related putative deaminase [Streptomyces sp. YGL11-2]|uniref:YwqJ-related putative deaminase n=1 Tax=Streptomyces sp. YGL11-2 TaxID=3414028 RepID=UPI003CF36EB4